MAGNDYNSFSTTLTFPSGSSGGSLQCTDVQILDDNFVEDDESFLLSATLVSPIPAGITIDRNTATVVIQDNDGKRKCTFKVYEYLVFKYFPTDIIYEFTQSVYSVQENAGPLQAAIRLTANSGVPLSAFIVLVNTGDITAQCKHSKEMIYTYNN